jgi:uncharacterized protein
VQTLIVDGYNVIYAWSPLKRALGKSGLEHARNLLTHMLSEYQAQTGMAVTVVYDAHNRGGGTQTETVDGVTVHYGSSTETADHVIERLAYNAARDGGAAGVLVATSDRLQRAMVTAMGVPTMSASALEAEVSRVLSEREDAAERLRASARSGNRVEDGLSEETRRRLEALRRGRVDDAGGAAETDAT